MKTQITGRGMDLTDAIKDYATKKAEALNKFYNNGILRTEIVVGINSKHHAKGDMFFAEYKLQVAGTDLFASKSADTLYKAIDMIRDYLELEIKKHKMRQRVTEKEKKQRRQAKEYKIEL
jgi:putative sigma-54 modulation protein